MPQKVTITEQAAGGASTVLVNKMLTTPSNIGRKSTPDYSALEKAAIRTFGSGDHQVKIYAGQTDDEFWVDLQVFDLLTLRGQHPPIGYGGATTSHRTRWLASTSHDRPRDPDRAPKLANEPVLGVWATARAAARRSRVSACRSPMRS